MFLDYRYRFLHFPFSFSNPILFASMQAEEWLCWKGLWGLSRLNISQRCAWQQRRPTPSWAVVTRAQPVEHVMALPLVCTHCLHVEYCIGLCRLRSSRMILIHQYEVSEGWQRLEHFSNVDRPKDQCLFSLAKGGFWSLLCKWSSKV